ncbi:MAG TPA: STAS domain-containing protein [Gemmatimonadales bacterium]|nr:STAS domain-containing protein [Gemmatimonadales bacterium]
MTPRNASVLPSILQKRGSELLEAWIAEQVSADTYRPDLISDAELRDQSRELLGSATAAASEGGLESAAHPAWQSTRRLLASIAESRAAAGFAPTATATFVLSLKQPLFAALRREVTDPSKLADELWQATTLIDRLALQTMETTLEARERIISRQHEDMLELSTPVVKLWDGILALPMIGTLDSARTQVVMESLLQRIVETGAEVAIIDITGVPTVDTLVAQHLIKTVTAARLMGADCIISGIRPQIAATIVHLGVDLSEVATKATLADAFRLALARTGHALGRAPAREKR